MMNALVVIVALAIHVVHTALGLPALEGIEQAILSPGILPHMRYRRPW